jgi:uncharacterized protein YggE
MHSIESEPGSQGGWRPPQLRWWWYAVAGAAAVAVLVGATLAIAGQVGRSGTGDSAVVIAPPAGQTSGASAAGPATADTAAPAAGAAGAAGASDAARSQSGAAPAVQSGFALPVPTSSCSASPTVQFQGRGLAATGVAVITGAEQMGTVSVTVQQSGVDPGGVLGAVQARLAAVEAALAQSGVPPASVQVSSFRTYGDSLGRQFTAYATVQATVTGLDALTAATRAVAQVPGVSAYAQSSAVAAEPTDDQVQDAVRRAADQARQMAESTAGAAGVGLGDARSVVTQPPVTCYGPSGPERVIQVTAMYSIR